MWEQRIERLLFATRWVLAPIYLGLSLALLALGVKFFQELFHVLPNVLKTAETDLGLTALALVDIALVGSLIIMVMLSGYENFVSKIDVAGAEAKIGWTPARSRSRSRPRSSRYPRSICCASS